ncbi:MAG: hypothetical protein QOD74_2800 [Variibacter sp.]|nr:hypothetical protein [Variibacter sp.]
MSLAQSLRNKPLLAAAAIIAFAGAAAISGAWLFQYGLGLAPCPLCLEQRWAYYVGVPIAALVGIGVERNVNRRFLAVALAIVALLFLWNAGLGVYHAGVEWHWWAGPQDCVGGDFAAGSAGNLLQRMQTTRVVRCDEAAWRFLGLSLAGYNALISLALAFTAVCGILTALRRPTAQPT